MKTSPSQRRAERGFTLLETVGVLAVIAIAAAVLTPKIFDAIANANISHAGVTLNTFKAAAAQHVARHGTLAIDGSTQPAGSIALDGSDGRAGQFDAVLLREGLVDGLLRLRIGDGLTSPTHARVQLVRGAGLGAEVEADNGAYDLDAAGSPNDALRSIVVEAVITGVEIADARALNALLDGTLPAFGEDGGGNGKGKGNGTTTVDVHVYLTDG